MNMRDLLIGIDYDSDNKCRAEVSIEHQQQVQLRDLTVSMHTGVISIAFMYPPYDYD